MPIVRERSIPAAFSERNRRRHELVDDSFPSNKIGSQSRGRDQTQRNGIVTCDGTTVAHDLGRSVDLIEKEGLRNPYRRHEILSTRRVVYAG
jgi:hypothetical protein